VPLGTSDFDTKAEILAEKGCPYQAREIKKKGCPHFLKDTLFIMYSFGYLQFFRATEAFFFGGHSTATFTNKLSVLYELLVIFKI